MENDMDETRTVLGLGWPTRPLAVLAVALSTSAVADVLDVMRGELERSRQVLVEQPTPIYYLSYEITEDKVVSVDSAFGALTGWNESQTRGLDIDSAGRRPGFRQHPGTAVAARRVWQLRGDCPGAFGRRRA